MRYRSFYKLIDLAVWDDENDTRYSDVWFRATKETNALMARLNFQAEYADGGFTVFYKMEPELPSEKDWERTFELEHSLYFIFETSNSRLLQRMERSIPDPQPIQKWIYLVGDRKPEKLYIYPALFTHSVTGDVGQKELEVWKDGHMLPTGDLNPGRAKSDDDGNYHFTANLSGNPTGMYELLVKDQPVFPVYIDTCNEASGKTGLLTLPRQKYFYGPHNNNVSDLLKYNI